MKELGLAHGCYGNRSTLVTSQMPVDKWHALTREPLLGSEILDRLVQNANLMQRYNWTRPHKHNGFVAIAVVQEKLKSMSGNC